MVDLKNCPFCGGRNVAQGASRDYISVWCTCGARGPDVPFPDDCIDPATPIRKCHELWNRRALQAVGPEPAVAVKPLEWKGRSEYQSAMTPWGYYSLKDALDPSGDYEWWGWVFTSGGDWVESEGGFPTIRGAKAAAEADYASRIRSALVATPPAEQHTDDIAVDRFAEAMKAKLKWEREERNRSGWQDMTAADLSRLLYEHLPKGDPIDVANLVMMLHQNGQQIEAPATTTDERAVEALRAVIRKYWNGRYFSGITDRQAEEINAALAQGESRNG